MQPDLFSVIILIMVETQKDSFFIIFTSKFLLVFFLWEILRDRKCSGIVKYFIKGKEERNC